MALDVPRRDRMPPFAFCMSSLILIGVFRICSTYSVFFQTWDEPGHIAAGIEWLDKGRYRFEPFHPPLARVMGALGPYLDGARVTRRRNMWEQGNAILWATDAYERRLTLARLGILPFFIIGALAVAAWARAYGGSTMALVSVAMFTTTPSILGHSGVATLDMACAAFCTAAFFAFDLWLGRPTIMHCCLLGVTAGLSILSKFSSFGFFVFSAVLILSIRIAGSFGKSSPENRLYGFVRKWSARLCLVMLMGSLVVWAGYRFSSCPLGTILEPPYSRLDGVVGRHGAAHEMAHSIVRHCPVPAPEFVEGIRQVFDRDQNGHLAYLCGAIHTQGWWYFHPLVLSLKTPIPLSLLSVIGVLFLFRRPVTRTAGLGIMTPLAAFLGVLAVGMLSHVDNGTRQMLTVYPLLAILAGYGASRLLSMNRLSMNRSLRWIGPAAVTVLLTWQVLSSVAAHPDYLAYFNELAMTHPEEIVVDSDLDWGQDLKRLETTLKKRGINELTIRFNGGIALDLDRFDLPARQPLEPYQRTTGWIAISVYHLKLGTGDAPYDQFAWLSTIKPAAKVGKSIWLYHIPEE